MRSADRRLMLLIATLISVVGIAPQVVAQDVVLDLDASDLDAPHPQAIPQPFIAMSNSTPRVVGRWVFGNAADSVVAQRQLNGQLNTLIRDIDFACDLTPPQEKKLELAGRGDIKHFLDQVEELEQRFSHADRFRDGRELELKQEIQAAARELKLTYRYGLFEEASMLEKVARRTLTTQQFASLQELRIDQRRLHYEGHTQAVIETLQKKLSLNDSQVVALRQLARTDTRPPLRWGEADNFSAHVVLNHIGMIPDEKLKRIFNDEQWRQMNVELREARGMEKFLRGQGWLPDEQ